MLNDIVENQLSEICRKGKLFDIDITDCITQNSSDDSSDFSCLSHDHEQKGGLKKKKAKKESMDSNSENTCHFRINRINGFKFRFEYIRVRPG